MLKIELMAQQYAVFMAPPMEKKSFTYAVQAYKGVQRSLLSFAFKQYKTGNVCCLESV